MNNLYLFQICTMAGTIFIISAYFYFYLLYRERYMGIWLVSWIIFIGRFLLFDNGMFNWKRSIWGFTFFQIMLISCGLMFVWGTHIFLDKPFRKNWLYSAASTFIISSIFNVLNFSLLYKLLLPNCFGGFVCIWIGGTFLRHLKTEGPGKLIMGYAYILWGLFTLFMPISINIAWLSAWCYVASGILRLIIVFSMLLLYFEKTRADLSDRESRYRLLTENAVDIIFHFQLVPEDKFAYISPAVFKITGYTPEEYYSNAELLHNQIHTDDLSSYENFVTTCKHAQLLPSLTVRLICKDKKTIWTEHKYVPIYDEAKKIVAIEGIIQDINARKNLELMAAKIDKMNIVGKMAVSVAHEIRNPLTTVIGYLQIMRLKEKNKDRYDLMIEELNKTTTIISDYLLLAQNKRAELKNGNLNEVLMKLLPSIRAKANAANISINLNLMDIPEIKLDENEVQQLFLNLVRNGLEAMSSGGELTIATSFTHNKVVLTIRDQGCGIPENILENLGTPFLTTKNTGTGLGLSICYQIANRHHAAINIETGNHGTTFYIYFEPSHLVA